MTTVFLSQKSQHAPAAKALRDALGIVFGRDEIFLAEEIKKGDDWRAKIDRALGEAKCHAQLRMTFRYRKHCCPRSDMVRQTIHIVPDQPVNLR